MQKDDDRIETESGNKKPYFDFQNLSPSENLTYEIFSWDNYMELYKMFRWDWSKFVSKDFKKKKRIWDYSYYQLYNARFSEKRGACDWYFKTHSGEYAGIIHLYDMSIETFADRHKRCTIGFATNKKFRGKGFTSEAVKHLLHHCFDHFEMNTVLSYTKKDNKKASGFLKKLHFVNNDDSYINDKYRYFEMQQSRFYNS